MKLKYRSEKLAGGFGFLIGALVCVPIVLFLISKLFFGAHNDVTEEDIKKYMNDSEQIEVKMPPYKSQFYVEDFGRKRIIDFLARGGKGTYTAFYITFYSQEYSKYFTVWFFSNDGVLYVRDGFWDESNVYLTVNRNFMKSIEYGTLENPIPVLKVAGVDKSLRYQDQDKDVEYMAWMYHTNVKGYLGYEVPKKEFKAMFRNK